MNLCTLQPALALLTSSARLIPQHCVCVCVCVCLQRGIIGSMMKEVNLLGNQIGREIDHMSHKINEAVYTSSTAPALVRLPLSLWLTLSPSPLSFILRMG